MLLRIRKNAKHWVEILPMHNHMVRPLWWTPDGEGAMVETTLRILPKMHHLNDGMLEELLEEGATIYKY